MYLPTASDDNDKYQHLPAMPGPSAMCFHSFALEISQLYITCALAKVTLLSASCKHILNPSYPQSKRVDSVSCYLDSNGWAYFFSVGYFPSGGSG